MLLAAMGGTVASGPSRLLLQPPSLVAVSDEVLPAILVTIVDQVGQPISGAALPAVVSNFDKSSH